MMAFGCEHPKEALPILFGVWSCWPCFARMLRTLRRQRLDKEWSETPIDERTNVARLGRTGA